MIRRGAAKRRLRAQAEETNWPVLLPFVSFAWALNPSLLCRPAAPNALCFSP